MTLYKFISYVIESQKNCSLNHRDTVLHYEVFCVKITILWFQKNLYSLNHIHIVIHHKDLGIIWSFFFHFFNHWMTHSHFIGINFQFFKYILLLIDIASIIWMSSNRQNRSNLNIFNSFAIEASKLSSHICL